MFHVKHRTTDKEGTTMYILVRRHPLGKILGHRCVFHDRDQIARAAATMLINNVHEAPAVAHAMGKRVAAGPVGKVWTHEPHNYKFRILPAHLTTDRKPIIPGLRVQENNLRWGLVDTAQFFDESPLMPGGEHFDGWYYVLRDGEHRPVKRFDGTRLSVQGLR